MKFSKIIFFAGVIGLIGCSNEKDKVEAFTKDCIVSFYNNQIQKIRPNLEDTYLHYIDSMILFDTINFNNKYRVSIIGSKEVSKKLFDVKALINLKGSDISYTLKFEVIKESKYKLRLEAEDFQKLLFYEDTICMNIGRMLYSKERDKEALTWFHFYSFEENAKALYYIGKIHSFDRKYEKALGYLFSALDGGYDEAIREINFIYSLHGNKVEIIKILVKEANRGNVIAMIELGTNYEMFNPDSAF